MIRHDPSRAPEISLERIGLRTVRAARWRAAEPTGRPLLFFNGIGANIELMEPLGHWIHDRDIVTFDMPGVGGSPQPGLPYRPWMMARLAAKLLDRFSYDTVDVMGVSWGGAMAQQFAFQYGRRVGKVILAATSPGTIMVPGDPRVLSKMADARRYMDPDFMRRNFRLLYGSDTHGADDHVARLSPPSSRGYVFQLASMLGWTSLPFLPLLKQKVLIMMGDADRIVPLVNGRILEALIPKARMEVVAGGGHLFLVSRAAEIVPKLVAFLNEPDAEAKPARRAKAA